MNFKTKFRGSWSSIFLAILLVAGCNIFNPTNNTSVDEDASAEALISYAQSLYRKSEYKRAAHYFSLAIAKDSTKSEAYFGLAKSGMRASEGNPLEILQLVTTFENGADTLMKLDKEEQNMIYRSMRAVDTALSPLIHRDTLTTLWETSRAIVNGDTSLEDLLTEFQADSLNNAGSELEGYELPFDLSVIGGVVTQEDMETFVDLYGPYPTAKYSSTEPFPATDGKYRFSRFALDYTVASFSITVLGFLDFNHDGFIDDNDITISISFGDDGEPEINVEEVMTAALTDTTVAKTLNENIDQLVENTENLTELISTMGSAFGITDNMADSILTSETQAKLDSQIQNYSDAIKFYKLGDGLDNDGDGCRDEEIYDSLDNDLDGFIDEDLRLVLLTSSPGQDMVDNDGDGLIDEADEYWDSSSDSANGESRPLPFARGFDKNDDGEFNSTQEDYKLEVVRDTTGLLGLEQRRAKIGGCWKYYDDTRLVEYLRLH